MGPAFPPLNISGVPGQALSPASRPARGTGAVPCPEGDAGAPLPGLWGARPAGGTLPALCGAQRRHPWDVTTATPPPAAVTQFRAREMQESIYRFWARLFLLLLRHCCSLTMVISEDLGEQEWGLGDRGPCGPDTGDQFHRRRGHLGHAPASKPEHSESHTGRPSSPTTSITNQPLFTSTWDLKPEKGLLSPIRSRRQAQRGSEMSEGHTARAHGL